jgi:S-adenosyl methyltransferase
MGMATVTDNTQNLDPDDQDLAGLDTGVARVARIQNYWRGGTDNFAADKSAAEHAMAAYPDLAASVRANRAFLGRAVRYLAADAGIRQFLDIGTGLPTAGSVHEIAQEVSPQCRVVYVDNDPMVLHRARELLAGSAPGTTSYVSADLRDVSDVLDQASRTLDLSAPLAIVLVSVLHMISDEEGPHRIVRELMAAAAPGSFLALTHVASDIESEAIAEMTRRMNQHVARPVTPRDHATVERFFAGLDLLPPGLMRVPLWHPESPEDAAMPSTQWGGVARKA